jgi:hypothetical protein
MPAGLVEQEDSVGAWGDMAGDFGGMLGHRLGDASRGITIAAPLP